MALQLVEYLCEDLAGAGVEGTTVTLKLKCTDFRVRGG